MKRILVFLFALLCPLVGHATVTTLYNSASFACTGSTGPYPFTFPISDPTAMTVFQNGVTVPSTSYTIIPVNNAYKNGGSVTLAVACPSGGTLLLLQRKTPLTQTQVFTNNMPIPMTAIENGLDKLTEIAQDQQAILDLGIVQSVTPGTNISCTPFVGGKCTGAITINGASSGTGIPYPGAGIANSSGSAWNTSYSNTNPIPASFLSAILPSQVQPSSTNGQILTTQGGVASWQPPSGATSPGGSVAYVQLTTLGAYTSCPTLTFSGGGSPSVAAVGTIVCDGSGNPLYALLTNAGYGYTSTPTVAVTGGAGGGGTAVAEMGSFVIALNTPVASSGAATPSLSNGILTIPYWPSSGGGSGCAIGTCVVNAGTANQYVVQSSGTSYGFSETSTYNGTQNFDGSYFSSTAPGWNNGTPYNGNTDWAGESFRSAAPGFMSATAGITQYERCLLTHAAEGDTQCAYDYFYIFGNVVNPNDEGGTYRAAHVYQIGNYYGPVVSATAGSNGTTLLVVTGPSCFGACSEHAYNASQFAVGGITVNQTSGVTGPYTVSNWTPNVDGAQEYALSSGTVTPSTAIGTISGTCTTSVQGKFGVYGTQTCTVSVILGSFVSGTNVFHVGAKEEEDTGVTVTGSGSTQTVTMQSMYPFAAGDFLGQGGPAGNALGPNTGTVTTVDLIAGALDSTHILFGHCAAGSGCAGGGNVVKPNTATTSANLSRNSGTGLVTATPNPYNFGSFTYLPVGSTIVITGAVPSDLNGTFTIASNTGDLYNSSITWVQSGSTETSTTAGTMSFPLPTINIYPAAMNCGTNNATQGDIQLCTNHATWNVADVAVGAESNEVELSAYNIYMGQSSGFNASIPSAGITLFNQGAQGVGWMYGCYNQTATDSECVNIDGNYSNDIWIDRDPVNNGALILDENNTHSTKPLFLILRGNSNIQILMTPSTDTYTFGPQGAGGLVASSLALPTGGSPTVCFHTDGSNGACGSGGSVSSVANSDGTLTITPTTGSVIASLALGHSNTWTAPQTFAGPVTVTGASQGLVFAAGTATTGTAGSVVYSVDSTHGYAEVNENNTGLARVCTSTNSICSTGGTGLSGMTAGQVPIAATASTVTSSVAPSIIINTITCPLGAAGCTVTLPPPVNYIFYPAATSDGGSSFASGCTRYSSNQPQAGSVNSAASALGYMTFQAAPSSLQYCEFTRTEPSYWTGTSMSFDFFSSATTGTVIWEVQTVCVISGTTVLSSSYSPTFGTASTVTTTVSGTANTLGTTTTLANVAQPGVGNCPASPTTPTQVTYRVFRSASDTAAANANLLGLNLGVGRSQ